MKRKLLYPLVFITASLSTGAALSVPLAPVQAVVAEQLGDDTDRGESSPTGARTNGQQTAVADQTALLLEVRERGKLQAARAAFDLDRLRTDRSATASDAGLEVEPRAKNAPPVSSLLPEPTQAQM